MNGLAWDRTQAVNGSPSPLVPSPMLWLLPIVAATALHAPAQPLDGSKLVKASLLVHDAKVKPGETVQLAVVLDVAKGWHIYWPGQNESGMATTVEFTFPKDSGLTAGPVSFPAPHRHVEAGDIINYTHEGKVILTVPVKVPSTVAAGTSFKVTANVSYLVCKDSCLPGEATLTTTLATAEQSVPGPDAKSIDDARSAQPRAQADGFDSAILSKWDGDTLTLTAKDASVTGAIFCPAEGGAKLLEPIKTGQAKGGTLRLAFEPGPKPAQGVVELTSGNGKKAWSLHIARTVPAVTPKEPEMKESSRDKGAPAPVSPAH